MNPLNLLNVFVQGENVVDSNSFFLLSEKNHPTKWRNKMKKEKKNKGKWNHKLLGTHQGVLPDLELLLDRCLSWRVRAQLRNSLFQKVKFSLVSSHRTFHPKTIAVVFTRCQKEEEGKERRRKKNYQRRWILLSSSPLRLKKLTCCERSCCICWFTSFPLLEYAWASKNRVELSSLICCWRILEKFGEKQKQ
jgi:hypothetical protein